MIHPNTEWHICHVERYQRGYLLRVISTDVGYNFFSIHSPEGKHASGEFRTILEAMKAADEAVLKLPNRHETAPPVP
jgi:hypothetical protein